MSYTSTPLPLQFWTRLQVRMADEYQAQRDRLAEALKPAPATVDTGDTNLQRSPQARAEVFSLVRELENIQSLLMILGGQVRIATFRAEILDVEAQITCLRNIAQVFEDFLCGLPRRLPLEQELQTALSQYAGLRTAGSGELILAERQRLRALTINLPVLGAEDTIEQERELRTLHSNIDQLEAELQSRKVSTLMALQVPDDLAELVTSFGVKMARDPEPEAQQADAPAAGAEQSDAAAPANS
ncbi:hypothetical protein WJ96_07320 [Burkholderia ubonensis]|uniref:Uncharacterized protein n=1 Tax=Burkholderia ubonensis TaxID=101571 RepID=A0AAW3MWK7_9BURK|nr:hypothetical protein [Burkholderia ubonensis]KVP75509.1 hypothetical protein WJ93_09110 [Burkholderia ubonensis]KVP96972.1 hypothetical protein WJ97_14220 [Burkholderia ubonensis]KVP98323.1 hypothetical protein WJ96_07320 [Burkholderia ubonensis]KVZ93021.1 hypothetical protein WL25_18980 [Burkholderia ubonensis]